MVPIRWIAMLPKRKQTRLRFVDYATIGAYYVTMCSYQKRCIFSSVDHEKIDLAPLGKIVQEELLNTPRVRPSVVLEQYVIMPNHIHVIFTFLDGKASYDIQDGSNPLRTFGGSQKGSLSSVVAHLKSIVTRRAVKELGFAKDEIWQRSFYEHIIRDEKDMIRIKDYMSTNPITWHYDHENPSKP